jgi:putative solute:sodium symporter small subunit
MPEISQDAKLRHWTRTRNVTMWVLAIWFVFSFVIPWFAAPLNAFSFIGFPLGYYMIVQGSLIVFVVLIFFQNWKQDQIDDEAGVGEK